MVLYQKSYCVSLLASLLCCVCHAQDTTAKKWSEYKYYYACKAAIDSINITGDWATLKKAYCYADSLGQAYINAYPDKPQGYFMRVNAAKKADIDSSLGLAVEPIKAANKFFLTDTALYGKTVFANDYYLFLYYYFHARGMAKIDQYRNSLAAVEEIKLVTKPGTPEREFAESVINSFLPSRKYGYYMSRQVHQGDSITTHKP